MNYMELKDFTKKAILEIIEAVDEAKAHSGRSVSIAGIKGNRVIEFDIAVSAETNKKDTGGGGIKVWKVFEAHGARALETKNASVSRIKFKINIDKVTVKKRR